MVPTSCGSTRPGGSRRCCMSLGLQCVRLTMRASQTWPRADSDARTRRSSGGTEAVVLVRPRALSVRVSDLGYLSEHYRHGHGAARDDPASDAVVQVGCSEQAIRCTERTDFD